MCKWAQRELKNGLNRDYSSKVQIHSMIQVLSIKEIAHVVTLWVDLKFLSFETLSIQEHQDALINLWTFNFDFLKFASF